MMPIVLEDDDGHYIVGTIDHTPLYGKRAKFPLRTPIPQAPILGDGPVPDDREWITFERRRFVFSGQTVEGWVPLDGHPSQYHRISGYTPNPEDR